MRKHITGGLALVLGTALAPPGAQAVTPTTVVCPDSIQVAIDSGFAEITVDGHCVENVFIRKDDITIQGDGDDTIEGQIWIDAARRITIQDLEVTGGPEHGIVAIFGSTITVRNVEIHHVPHVGVIVNRNSSGILDNVRIHDASFGVSAAEAGTVDIGNGSLIENITNNGVESYNGANGKLVGSTVRAANLGVFVGGNGYIEVTDGSVIENNVESGISLHRGGDSLLIGSFVQNNGGVGISVDTNCSAFADNMTIIGNGGDGIDIANGSSGSITNSTIQNNGGTGVSVGGSSNASLDTNTIQAVDSPVAIGEGSSARLSNNTITHTTTDNAALDMSWGATVTLLGGNTLNASPIGYSIFLQQGSTLIQRRARDTANGPVYITKDSNVELRDIEITGNVYVEDHSLLRLRALSADSHVTVRGNTTVSLASGLNFVGSFPVKVVGDISCLDQESSLSKGTLSLTGKIKPGCTGY